MTDHLPRLANIGDRAHLLVGDGAVDIELRSDGRLPADPMHVIEVWDELRAWAAGGVGEPLPYDALQLGPCVPRPRQVFAIGLNYADHAAETGRPLPEGPLVFTKFPSCIAAPSGPLVLPTANVDWEVELVAVIGAGGHDIPPARGWDHVAGLTVGQDISDRVTQFAAPPPQFGMGKSYPGFSPMGPALVSVDELRGAGLDPDDLELGCLVNGESVQKGRTGAMIFSVPDLVAELSAIVTLLPGDVVFTGTPAGIGAGRTPPRFLGDGDELVTWCAGIGQMQHRFVTGDPA